MELTNIVGLVNQHLAGESLTYNELKPFLDKTIDEINSTMNAVFPAFSELDPFVTNYDMIPERYIRSVLVPGATWYFYVMDEEGLQAAPQYQLDYRSGLYLMLRDYSSQVPLIYQAPDTQGMVTFDFETNDPPGISVSTGEW